MSELIQKYFEGVTSLEEEERLRDYFQSEKVADEWKIYQAKMFWAIILELIVTKV
ncbi:MAG: hypothetical protein LBG77_03800 [Dysgonamonadaceae bacterium]|nr:hypothetical protein [Dysgonamonadaceae bacterium]